MSKHNSAEVDKRFRAEANRLAPIVVSWSEVDAQSRRQRRFHLLSLILATVGLALALTVAFLAVKTLFDPTYEPPLISSASASGRVAQPAMGRGIVSRGEFLSRSGGTAVASSAAEEEGYSLAATVRLNDLQEDTLVAEWRLREVGKSARPGTVAAAIGRAAIEAETIGDITLIPDSRSETRRLRGWVPAPTHSGLYVAEMVLVAKGHELVGNFKSEPFEVVGRDCCSRYETPSYKAALPRRWRIAADYKPAPGGRFVSEAVGPRGAVLIIDTTPHASGAAIASERYLEGLFRANTKDYRRIALRRGTDRGREVVEWSYQVEGKADTEELFYRKGGGFAIRGVSQQAHFRETRELCRMIERTLRSRRELRQGK
jgi:hypothetical protein